MLELFDFDPFRGVSLFFFLGVAACAWCGGAYAIYRGFQCLPDGRADFPFLSDDPQLITPEGLKWRGRVYLAVLYFASAVAFAVLLNQA